MKPPDRQLLKLAALILASVSYAGNQHFAELQEQMNGLQSTCQRLEPLRRLLRFCQEKQWLAAGRSVQDRIEYEIAELNRSVARIEEWCKVNPTSAAPAPQPTLRDILGELRQLEEEFDGFDYDLKARTVSVTTEHITLEDIDLGRFEIELEFKLMADGASKPSYIVKALEPNPASSNDSVTHPHVRDEDLCEGDATLPIRLALESGRVCDFFVLVRSVLQHYNSGSPFVALSDWNGTSCDDCGYVSGETSCCQCCNNDFCEECISYCRGCDTTMCRNCLEKCAACEERVCSDCRKLCKECREITCVDCLEETELCPTCRKKAEDENERRERELLERQQEINAQQRDAEEWNFAQQLDQQQRDEAAAAIAAAEEIIVANAAA